MIEQTTPIQVEELEQPKTKEEGEQMQDRELAQQIEKLVEVTNMELGQEPRDQDTDLMPRALEVTSQSPPPLVLEPVPSEQGEVGLLDNDRMMDVYNLSFDVLHKKIVQVRRKNFPDDHVSHAFMKERVIVSDVRKHPVFMANATLDYTRAMSSNVKFLLAEIEQTKKNLQLAR